MRGPYERAFIPARYADLPTLGRLTGRGNTTNVEAVLAARPDLVLDYGALTEAYRSLADCVQQQTGIPYLLFVHIRRARWTRQRRDGRTPRSHWPAGTYAGGAEVEEMARRNPGGPC